MKQTIKNKIITLFFCSLLFKEKKKIMLEYFNNLKMKQLFSIF